MVDKQNVTLSLPRPLLKKAKILAASCDKSLSELLKESLEEKVNETTGYKKAKERQKRFLKTGFNFGTKGHLSILREMIHERSKKIS